MSTRTIRIGLLALLLTGCASRGAVLELQSSIIHESPKITRISHSVHDGRLEGGTVVIDVTVVGDPGLAATFDITPGIVASEPMQEVSDGRYAGKFAFPPERTGGPFTVIGRLRHDEAGEVTMKDPDQINISLVR